MSKVPSKTRSEHDATKEVAVVVSHMSLLDWRLEKWLRSHCRITVYTSIGALLSKGVIGDMDLVLLVANRSRSFHQVEIDQAIAESPFVRMVCINSAWSDGDRRNGQEVAGVMHVHWSSTLVYLERWIHGAIEFPLSRIPNPDLQLPLAERLTETGTVVSVVAEPLIIELWRGVLGPSGVETHDFRDNVKSDVLLIDSRTHCDVTENMCADVIERCTESRVVLLSHMPRQHSVANVKRLGVDHVLRHPVSLTEVISVIQNVECAASLRDAA